MATLELTQEEVTLLKECVKQMGFSVHSAPECLGEFYENNPKAEELFWALTEKVKAL
jgi:hypothetical protein